MHSVTKTFPAPQLGTKQCYLELSETSHIFIIPSVKIIGTPERHNSDIDLYFSLRVQKFKSNIFNIYLWMNDEIHFYLPPV